MIPPADLEKHLQPPAIVTADREDVAPWRTAEERYYQACAVVSFVRTCANWLEADFDEVLHLIDNAPASYVVLADSPQGWTGLNEYVALSLGIDAAPLFPTIH